MGKIGHLNNLFNDKVSLDLPGNESKIHFSHVIKKMKYKLFVKLLAVFEKKIFFFYLPFHFL